VTGHEILTVLEPLALRAFDPVDSDALRAFEDQCEAEPDGHHNLAPLLVILQRRSTGSFANEREAFRLVLERLLKEPR
jgi:hypothetical protein